MTFSDDRVGQSDRLMTRTRRIFWSTPHSNQWSRTGPLNKTDFDRKFSMCFASLLLSLILIFLFVQVHVWEHHLHLSYHDGDYAGLQTNQNSLHRGFHFQGSRCFSRCNRSTFSTDLALKFSEHLNSRLPRIWIIILVVSTGYLKPKWNVTPLLLGGGNYYFFTGLYCACIGQNAQFALPTLGRRQK